jgi:hypothetical protein
VDYWNRRAMAWLTVRLSRAMRLTMASFSVSVRMLIVPASLSMRTVTLLPSLSWRILSMLMAVPPLSARRWLVAFCPAMVGPVAEMLLIGLRRWPEVRRSR